MKHNFCLLFAVIIVMLSAGQGFATGSQRAHMNQSEVFPVFESIKPAIAFWKKIFTDYSTSQGVIHDRLRGDVIYEVIALKPLNSPGARRINKKRVKAVKKKYKAVLRKLAAGAEPGNALEKRVAGLFGPHPKRSEFREASRGIRFQLGQKDRFRKGLIRSGAYIDQIRAIFRQYDLPEALAYLPHVESSFNYKAYSKFGAAGIWQFTRGTGRLYLTIDYALDERRDPIRATHAAAQFLKHNYEKLGSWPLAVTAYNHGTHGMARAKERVNGNYEDIFNNYSGRRFGFASRNFYAEFLAAIEIAQNHTRYFPDLKLAAPSQTTEIALPDYADLDDLARHFRIDKQRLIQLNPALRKPVHQGQKYVPKGYWLRLPEQAASLARIPSELLKSKQKPSRFYNVRRGDTAGRIAREHGVRLNDLILANQLDRRATIYVGQNLRIPAKGEQLLAAADRGAAKKAVAVKPASKSEKVTPPSVEAESETASSETEEIVEKSDSGAGETESGEMVAAVISPETISESDLASGDVIPHAAPETASDVTPVAIAKEAADEKLLEIVNPEVVSGHLRVERVETENGRSIGYIRVEVEETLGHYADWLQIPTWRIRRLNGFPYGRPIHVHQMIKVPFGAVTREMFEERRYEYHKEIEEDFFSAYNVVQVEEHVVRPGENMWELCIETFDLPVWLVRKYNPALDAGMLQVGRKIRVPRVEKVDPANGVPET